MTTIYVTKYAFSRGVYAVDAVLQDGGRYALALSADNRRDFYSRNAFRLTEHEAHSEFERLKAAKLKSLEKAMAKIRAAEFKVTHK